MGAVGIIATVGVSIGITSNDGAAIVSKDPT